jgi:hypothetical protein
MSTRSFRSPSLRLVPGPVGAKTSLVLVAAFILAGCGGSGAPKTQAVAGDGFRFQAPADWTVAAQTATHGTVDLLEVRIFTLLKPYRTAIKLRAFEELDRATAELARKSGGKVTARSTRTVGGHDARTYRLAFDGKAEELTYVLVGRREYLLICRLPTGAPNTPCDLLLSSFTVT